MDSFSNILRSGNYNQILKYVEEKNIYDKNIFNPSMILWMLRDVKFYSQIINILKKRKFFIKQIWVFAYLHKDMEGIKEYIKMNKH